MLRRAPGVLPIGVAAAMWGADALFRRPLAPALRALVRAGARHVAVVGPPPFGRGEIVRVPVPALASA